jgi:hypothetical protein
MHPETIHETGGSIPDFGRKENGEAHVAPGAEGENRHVLVLLVPETAQIIFFWRKTWHNILLVPLCGVLIKDGLTPPHDNIVQTHQMLNKFR